MWVKYKQVPGVAMTGINTQSRERPVQSWWGVWSVARRLYEPFHLVMRLLCQITWCIGFNNILRWYDISNWLFWRFRQSRFRTVIAECLGFHWDYKWLCLSIYVMVLDVEGFRQVRILKGMFLKYYHYIIQWESLCYDAFVQLEFGLTCSTRFDGNGWIYFSSVLCPKANILTKAGKKIPQVKYWE